MDGDIAGFQQRQRELGQALAACQNNLEQSKLRQKELAEEKRLFEESNAEVTASLCEDERAEAEHDHSGTRPGMTTTEAGGESQSQGSGPARVRRQCRAAAAAAAAAGGPVRVNADGARALAREAGPAAVRAAREAGEARPIRLPLQFPDMEAEVNMIAVMVMFAGGSGFRKELHARPGGAGGAWDTVRRGCLGLFLKDATISADTLATLTRGEVESNFDVASQIEAAHPELGPAVKTNVEGPLYRLVEHLLRASQDCGRVLRERQKRSLGHFVLDALEDVGPSASGLVDRLVAAFPAQFRDEAEFEGEPVAFYKKAMLLASELHKRFAAEDPRFAFSDMGALPGIVDNVVPAVLRQAGVLEVADSLAAKIDANVPLPAGSADEVALRACAVHAVELMAEELGGEDAGVTPTCCSDWLWGTLGKSTDYRTCERHATKDTFFY